jgi:hypothetical protein
VDYRLRRYKTSKCFYLSGCCASHVIVTSYVFSEGKVQWERLEHFSKTVGKGNWYWTLAVKKEKASTL